MDRQSVTSSNISSIGYDASSQTLEVEFKHGGIYQYYDVPQHEYEGLMNAPSHGKYFVSYLGNKRRADTKKCLDQRTRNDGIRLQGEKAEAALDAAAHRGGTEGKADQFK